MQRNSGVGRNENCLQDNIWKAIRREVTSLTEREPILANFHRATILDHDTLGAALSCILAEKLSSSFMSAVSLRQVFDDAYASDDQIIAAAACDICATIERDPAVDFYSTPLLHLKGFHALQGFRVANWLWSQGRCDLAVYLQNQISFVCQVDVHPAASIGRGIMFDHATGIVIGETAIIEDDVSILQDVTLGGTGKKNGIRHPLVRTGVMIGAGAKVLGNIEIGEGAKIAAGSVVLNPVPSHTTVAGVPAKIVGKPKTNMPSLDMDQKLSGSDEFIGGGGI